MFLVQKTAFTKIVRSAITVRLTNAYAEKRHIDQTNRELLRSTVFFPLFLIHIMQIFPGYKGFVKNFILFFLDESLFSPCASNKMQKYMINKALHEIREKIIFLTTLN